MTTSQPYHTGATMGGGTGNYNTQAVFNGLNYSVPLTGGFVVDPGHQHIYQQPAMPSPTETMIYGQISSVEGRIAKLEMAVVDLAKKLDAALEARQTVLDVLKKLGKAIDESDPTTRAKLEAADEKKRVYKAITTSRF